jgi:hypothetical protein
MHHDARWYSSMHACMHMHACVVDCSIMSMMDSEIEHIDRIIVIVIEVNVV